MKRQPKRCLIKEEFVELTGDFVDAVILAQMEYWQRRTEDIDAFISEENGRRSRSGIPPVNVESLSGWVYKTSQQLGAETMLGLADESIRRHLSRIVSNGWLMMRDNPTHRWDRTKQYRLDLKKIEADLEALGWSLTEWSKKGSDERCNPHQAGIDSTPVGTRATENVGAIPEITTETTSEISQSVENEFGAFYSRYPKKIGKRAALKAYAAARKRSTWPTTEDVLAAVEDQRRSKQWSDPQYIPHPATWLNQDRWLDELPAAAPAPQAGPIAPAKRSESLYTYDGMRSTIKDLEGLSGDDISQLFDMLDAYESREDPPIKYWQEVLAPEMARL